MDTSNIAHRTREILANWMDDGSRVLHLTRPSLYMREAEGNLYWATASVDEYTNESTERGKIISRPLITQLHGDSASIKQLAQLLNCSAVCFGLNDADDNGWSSNDIALANTLGLPLFRAEQW